MTGALDDLLVVDASTLFAGPDDGDAPRRPGRSGRQGRAPRRAGPRPRARAREGRPQPLVQDAGPQQAQHPARPVLDRRRGGVPPAGCATPTSSSRTSGRTRWSAGASPTTGSREANPGLVLARVTGFGQIGPVPPPSRVRHARRGDERVRGDRPASRTGRRPCRRSAWPTGSRPLATAFAVMAALHQRQSTGAGQVVDVPIIEPIMALLGPQISRWDQLHISRRAAATVPSNNAPRNTYRPPTATGWRCRPARRASPSGSCASWAGPRTRRGAVVRDRRGRGPSTPTCSTRPSAGGSPRHTRPR